MKWVVSELRLTLIILLRRWIFNLDVNKILFECFMCVVEYGCVMKYGKKLKGM